MKGMPELDRVAPLVTLTLMKEHMNKACIQHHALHAHCGHCVVSLSLRFHCAGVLFYRQLQVTVVRV